MRKTRKYPDMFGSIRKRKNDLRLAKRFESWHKMMTSHDETCKLCVSEPICLT